MSLYLLLLAFALASGQPPAASTANPRVALETSMGRIELELEPGKAPKSVENFLAYVDAGHYDNTIFHRVIPSFMIQGGGFTAEMNQKRTRDAVQNEADNGLKNSRGTVAMARTGDPHSATAQFFISSVDNTFLNHTAKTPQGWGYTVFATVVEGMDVVDRISAVATGNQGAFQDVPKTPVVIKKATRVTPLAPAAP